MNYPARTGMLLEPPIFIECYLLTCGDPWKRKITACAYLNSKVKETSNKQSTLSLDILSYSNAEKWERSKGQRVMGSICVALGCSSHSTACLWQPEQTSPGQEVPEVIWFGNPGWCLVLKLVTCQPPAIWKLGFLCLIKYLLCLRGDMKYHSISVLKYFWLEHEISLYGTSKTHNCILGWAFDILIFGQ